MKKILVFPSDMGGGFGHIGRCLNFAARLKREGHRPAFALNGFHAQRVEKQGYPAFLLGWDRESLWKRLARKFSRQETEGPVFHAVHGLDYQVVRDGIYNREIAASRLEDCLGVIDTFKPDLLVGDTHLFVAMAGAVRKIPVLQNVRAAIHPDARPRPFLREAEGALQRPLAGKILNPLLTARGLDPVERTEDLLRGDLILIPSIPRIDPAPEVLRYPTEHIGTLLFHESNEEESVRPDALFPSTRKIVYVTIGGGAGPEGGGWLFDILRRVCPGMDANFIISVSPKYDPSRLGAFGSNTVMFRWVKALEVMKNSDLVLFPGGYGTAMTVWSMGIPSLVIPSHSDPEYNGRKIQDLGAGLVLFPFTEKMETLAIPEPPGGTVGIYSEVSLTPEIVRTHLNRLLGEAHFSDRAGEMGRMTQRFRETEGEKIFQKILKEML